jgi:redox-sensitive bicupin YhaK (pirin superfamily)
MSLSNQRPVFDEPTIEHEIRPQQRDVDGAAVARILPSRVVRMVGPVVFLDHFGPADVPPGRGMDVRPHPHIHLSTVTYLVAGEVLHRDSLGSEQLIRPGAINWMTAGRGIVHSERSPPAARAVGGRMHGLQLWVASPVEAEDVDPSFSHHPREALPTLERPGVEVRVLAGNAYGLVSPVPVQSPLCYFEAHLAAGARLELTADHRERALLLLSGQVELGVARLTPGRMVTLTPGAMPTLIAEAPTHLIVIGGEPIGERYIWWNFVSSDKASIVEAARAWRAGELPTVPGDELEFIPLETEPHFA